MSALNYFSYNLDNILTHSLSQEPILSEDGTEYMWTKFTLSVQGVMGANYAPSTPGESAAETMARVRHDLEQPRGNLQFSVDGKLLIDSSGTDVAGGPRVKDCKLTHIAGSGSIIYNFTVEVCLVECPAGTQPLYASHRYSEAVSIDENFYTTRTRTGKVIVRASLATPTTGDPNPDTLRKLVAAECPAGFKRIKQEWTLASDGLSETYTLVDQEQYLQPPGPATRASGKYIQSSPHLGLQRFIEVQVSLEGPKNADKGALITAAIQMAVSKIFKAGEGFNKRVMLENAAVSEQLFKNAVDVVIRVKATADPRLIGGLPLNKERFGSDLAGVTDDAPDPGTRGTAKLLLKIARWIDPCLPAEPPGQASMLNQIELINANGPIIKIAPNIPEEQSNLWEEPDDKGVYTNYVVKSEWSTDGGILQLPLAGNAAQIAQWGCSIFVQTAAPQRRLVVEWVAERVGEKPALPHPCLGDDNLVLLQDFVAPEQAEVSSDGQTFKWVVSGRYVFGLKNAPTTYRFPATPNINAQAYSTMEFGMEIFSKFIVGTGTGNCPTQLLG